MTPLRAEVDALRAQRTKATRLRNEVERRRAVQVSPAELEQLKSGQAAAEQLRREITGLKAKLGEKPKSPAASVPPATRFVAGATVPASEWKNAGAATPEAALESALWAAVGGDVEAFARRLVLDWKARAPAKELWESLTPAMRADYDTPEKLMAFLSIKDVPTGSAQVRRWMQPSGESGVIQPVTIALLSPDGAGKEVQLVLAREPQTTEWKLMVTQAAITKAAAMLKGKPLAAGAK